MAKCVWVLEREEITTHICEIQETDVRGWLSMVMSSMEQVDLTLSIGHNLGMVRKAKSDL
jgi:hypothetical protein